MRLSRDIQCAILSSLLETYAKPTTTRQYKLLCEGHDEDVIVANLLYLEEHKLIKSGVTLSPGGQHQISLGVLKITAPGIDFMLNDGGLGAILKIVTVRIHDDTLSRIEAFLQQADIEPQEKEAYLKKLKQLPFDATKHVVLKLLDSALSNAAAALPLLQKLLG